MPTPGSAVTAAALYFLMTVGIVDGGDELLLYVLLVAGVDVSGVESGLD